MNFSARLAPHRSTWAIVRLTWAPLFVTMAVVLAASALRTAAPTAADGFALLAGPLFIAAVLYVAFTWKRGPMLTIEGGTLTLGELRLAVAEVQASVEQHVFKVSSRYIRGTFWHPLLVLRLTDGSTVRIVCPLGGGGEASGRKPSPAPNYNLEPAPWNELAALLGASGR